MDPLALSARLRMIGERAAFEPINALYGSAWALYHNHFCPSVKLVENRREGARQIKRYDRPKTQSQRLLDSGVLDEQRRLVLDQQHAKLNPCALKRHVW